MKTNLILLASMLALSISFSLSSCSKDDDKQQEETTKDLIPLSLQFPDHKEVINYFYDNQDRITGIELRKEKELVYRTLIAYDNDGKVVQTNYTGLHNSIIHQYRYLSNDTIVRIIDNNENSKDSIIINEKENIIRFIRTNAGENHIYHLNNNGNLTGSENRYGYSTIFEYNYQYAYDNQKGIYSNVKSPAWILIQYCWGNGKFSTNNIVSATENTQIVEEYNYSYNANGYPDSFNAKYIYGDDDIEEETILVNYRTVK